MHHFLAEGCVIVGCVCGVCVGGVFKARSSFNCCHTQSANKACLSDKWCCKHWARPQQLPEDHPCMHEISRKSPYQAYYGHSLLAWMVCALHLNVIIYSSLRLNAAVNGPSDSITPCPRRSTDESCLQLIKLQKTIEMAKAPLKRCHLRMLPRPQKIPNLIKNTEVLILRESSPHFTCFHNSEIMLTFGGPCHEVPCVPLWMVPSGLVYSRLLRPQ